MKVRWKLPRIVKKLEEWFKGFGDAPLWVRSCRFIFAVSVCAIHRTILNLHCLSPLTIDSSITTSTGLPKAPSNSALAHPLEQLQYVADNFPGGILFTCEQ